MPQAKINTPVNITSDNLTEEQRKAIELAKLKAEQKKIYAQMLDRGLVYDRMSVQLPPDLHGEWVRNDAAAINRLATLGFRDGSDYVRDKALHSDGTGKVIVADVVFMVIDKIKKEAYDEAISELGARRRGDNREEKEFASSIETNFPGVEPVISESSRTQQVGADEITTAVAALRQET